LEIEVYQNLVSLYYIVYLVVKQKFTTFISRKKLPLNPMDRGVLTDGADYIFLDGRPTPFGMKQKRKLLLQREYAVSYIVCYKYK